MEGAKNWYNKQYETWVPWVEDKVLGWWGENKTSYVAKGMSCHFHRVKRRDRGRMNEVMLATVVHSTVDELVPTSTVHSPAMSLSIPLLSNLQR